MGYILLVLAVLVLPSCELVSNIIHDDDVVARLGKRRLYRTELEQIIPSGVSPEDSAAFALQYINSWAIEKLYSDIAAQQLSKNELDVTQELEDYKSSLLKFRYEQRYLNERLDTVVSHAEIDGYYDAHKELFLLDAPIVRARFLDIMQESPNRERIKSLMSSDEVADLETADSLAYSSALKYEDNSDKWVDMTAYARNFGTDYGTLLSKMDSKGFIEIQDGRGDVKIGFICDIQKAGEYASVEYCTDRIKDIIISSRKQTLLGNLEKDLLQDAFNRQSLIIY